METTTGDIFIKDQPQIPLSPIVATGSKKEQEEKINEEENEEKENDKSENEDEEKNSEDSNADQYSDDFESVKVIYFIH